MYITTFHSASRKREYDLPEMRCRGWEVQKSQNMGWIEKGVGSHKLGGIGNI